ncbi:hypothetical protein [Wolinella succinogenes]|uniref:hypothetical protein n=1 Tax=Wolinella succinogenes TaxID=844 RepID=UPI00059F469B|nr:hypothetical protein [Wolinella succinogenes]VEG82397.1 Uncharacterised protein [Wolinella succinogenes]
MKTKRLEIRIDQETMLALEFQAKRAKKTKSKYIRDLISARAQNHKITTIYKCQQLNFEVIRLIASLTSNVNQIAYHLNSGKIEEVDMNDFFKTAYELKKAAKDVKSVIAENNLILRNVL